MRTKVVFLDRDGTINEDKGHTHKIEDLKFISKTLEALKKLQEAGYKLIIITNRDGIAKGIYTKEDYFIFRTEMHKQLKNEGIIIDAEYFCPHHSNDNCNCRKPKIGMFEQAARDFDFDFKDCWMIGDKDVDILAGQNAGCKTVHVLTGQHGPVSYANFIARDLNEAADYIITDKNK